MKIIRRQLIDFLIILIFNRYSSNEFFVFSVKKLIFPQNSIKIRFIKTVSHLMKVVHTRNSFGAVLTSVSKTWRQDTLAQQQLGVRAICQERTAP